MSRCDYEVANSVGVDFHGARVELQGYVRSEEAFVRTGLGAKSYSSSLALFDAAISSVKLAKARDECKVGTASLGALLWLAKDWSIESLLHASYASIVSRASPDYQMMWNALNAISTVFRDEFWNWDADLNSDGWPLFALLGLLAERLATLSVGETFSDQTRLPKIVTGLWAWLQTPSWVVPAALKKIAEDEYLRQRPDVCSARMAATLFALPAKEAGTKAVLEHVSICRATNGITAVLQPAWVPIWWGLDRAVSERVLAVFAPPLVTPTNQGWLTRQVGFDMLLHPPHVHHVAAATEASWCLSDRTRASGESHCSRAFQTTVESLTAACGARPLRLIVIGAYLGDSCFWAATRLSQTGVRCLAVETSAQSTELIRESIQMNDAEDAVQVLEGRIGGPMPSCQQETSPYVLDSVSGDCLLDRWGPADLVSILVDQFSIGLLEGLLGSLRAGRVGAVLLRTGPNARAEDVTSFVERHSLRYEIQQFSGGREIRLVRPGLLGRWTQLRFKAVRGSWEKGADPPSEDFIYVWNTVRHAPEVGPLRRNYAGAWCVAGPRATAVNSTALAEDLANHAPIFRW